MILDVHNHYYPPEYLAELKKGHSTITVDEDAEGNPRVHYPGDYGFIPRTYAEDNDPCDILVLVNEPTFPGCQIDARPIGVLRMLDRGEPDDKILSVPSHDPFYQEYFDIADIPQHYLKEVEHFFHIYKDLEGRLVQTVGWEKSTVAMEVIMQAIRRYEEKYLQFGP